VRVTWSRAIAVVTAFACVLVAPAGAGVVGAAHAAPREPVVLIVLENKTYSDIVGNAHAPYIQSLIAGGTLYTNYQAAPGSLPDYLRMTSGVATTSAAKSSDNLFNQLQGTGQTWGEYMESMPKVCYTQSGPLPYDKTHNPAAYYHDITSTPAACANMVPYTSFDPAHPRSFSYVVPNDNDNMHTGSSKTAEIAAGDAWLKAHVPAMLSGGALVIVTWDEGKRSDEHVATIAIGGSAAKGMTDAHAYTHFGLLAGLEDAYGVPHLNSAKTATPFPIS
jgi:phosphatidylinositol-3-phosphatase